MSNSEADPSGLNRILDDWSRESARAQYVRSAPEEVREMAVNAALEVAEMTDEDVLLLAMELDEDAGSCISGTYRQALNEPPEKWGCRTHEEYATKRLRVALARSVFRMMYYDEFSEKASEPGIPKDLLVGSFLAQTVYEVHAGIDKKEKPGSRVRGLCASLRSL